MAQLVTAPTRRPRVGGIKDVVAFTPEPRLSVAFGSGGIAWEDAACGLPAATKAGCYDEAVAQADKTGDGPDWYGSILTGPFAQYKGVECWLGGDNEGAKYEEQARAILEAGEDRMIEARLWAWATDGSTIAAAANLQIAVAALEDEADGAYVGQGIILMNRRDAEVAAAAGVIEYKDGALRTKLQTPVVASSQIPQGELAIVGAIGIYVGDLVVHLGRQLSENVALGIAERVYDIGVDCAYRVAVTVTP
jgi:hypothetical protein